MSAALIWAEPWIRLGTFALVFTLMALSEHFRPVCRLPPRLARWRTNLGLTVAATLLLRVALPVAAVGTAIWAQDSGVGLFNYYSVPLWLSLLLSLAGLDLLIYGQHVAFHRIGLFWRLHKVHHADPALDVTTALRFHPLEIFISMIVKIAAVVAFGIPPVAVLGFEILLNASAMFNHANLQLGATVNRLLVRFIVTPDMHRVHHSVEPDAQNRNFGFNLSLWDRLFGTFRQLDRPALASIRIGLGGHDDVKPTRFIWSLILPFLKTSLRPEPSGVSKP
ncbi:MAG: sterol desaturase family protein [Parvibaculum sp.]|nr:sterol desaturase family protein [Parvibaculum sp.]|tara:strand:- start:7668 stop:8504 length:837 start_codon:yes stop_codon:yes gene_type:complete